MRAEFLLLGSVVLALSFVATAALAPDEALLLVLIVGGFVQLAAVGLIKKSAAYISSSIAFSALISMQVLLILLSLGLCALVLLGAFGSFRTAGALVAGGIALVAHAKMYIWYRRLVLDSIQHIDSDEKDT
jgi:hypothetical protein